MQIVYVDMDNVLVDFPAGLKKLDPEIKAKYKDDPDEIPGPTRDRGRFGR